MNFGKSLVEELLSESNIEKVIALYAGRFQMFSSHHAKTFKWIRSKFGANNSYIVTSDKVEIPKSPFNFNEKKKVINKYGFSNVVKVKNPYVASELTSKFNLDTTSIVFVVGKKDADRLSSSKFFRKWEGTATIPYKEGAYYLIAPHISISVSGYGEMDGTTIRRALGDKSKSDKKDLFKDIFGFYDASIYKLVVGKLEALNEIMMKFSAIISESSNNTSLGKSQVDDGPRFFYGNQKTYRTKTRDMALRLGFEVANYLIGKEEFEVHDTDFPDGPPQSVTYFPVGLAGVYGVGTNYFKDLKGKPAFSKWSRNIMRIAQMGGYEFISFLGAEKSIESSKYEPKEEEGTNIIKEDVFLEESILNTDWWRKQLLLTELEFDSKKDFVKYKSKHKIKPDTKVSISGKEATVKDVEEKGDLESKEELGNRIKKLDDMISQGTSGKSIEDRQKEEITHLKRKKEIDKKIKVSETIDKKYNKLISDLYSQQDKYEGNENKLNKIQKRLDGVHKEWDESMEPYQDYITEDSILNERLNQLKFNGIKREEKLQKRKGGGQLEILDDQNRDHKAYTDMSLDDEPETSANLDKQYKKNNPLSKMSDEDKNTSYNYINNWKAYGAYELNPIGKDYTEKRNKYMDDVASKGIIQTPPPKHLTRGIMIENSDLDEYLSNFKIGKTTSIRFPQGFSASEAIANKFGTPPDGSKASVKLFVLPNSKDKITGLHVDGITNDKNYKKHINPKNEEEEGDYDRLKRFKTEQEVVVPSKSKMVVENIIERRAKSPEGEDLVYIEIYMREVDKLGESMSLLFEGKYDVLKKYSGPLIKIRTVVEKELDGYGKVYFAKPEEGDTIIKLYSDVYLQKSYKIPSIKVSRVYLVSKYNKQLDKTNKIIGKSKGIKEECKKVNTIKENLIQHANHELKLAGLFDEDADYNGMIAKATLELIEKFSEQGHSGFSAQWVRDVFHRLSNFETLTPITSNQDEWMDVSKSCGGTEMWQNKRNPAIFSKDGGETWYNVDEKIVKESLQSVYKKLIEKYDIPPDIISSFSMQSTLNPKLWDNHKLKPEIRKKLLVIANNFFKELKIDVKIHDIVLTGSVANYNWSKYSDVDLHLRIKFSEVDENEDLVENYVLSKKTVWNEEHDIEMFGFPVEIYVENVGETHIASGLYSVLNDKWIVEPKKKKLQIDIDDIQSKVSGYLSYVSVLKKYIKDKEYNRVISIIDKIREKLKRMRQSGLETGGEYSVENIAFKALRRSSFISTILDMKTKAYDKEMSVGENLIVEGGGYGRIPHLFDDNNITFGDIKNIIDAGLQGKLDMESDVVAKVDGQNLMVTWKDGKLKAARNKTQLKNPIDAGQLKSMFSGRGELEKSFVFGMKDVEKAVSSLNDKQRSKIFKDGKTFMSLEIIYPGTKNVIDYDGSYIVFHGTIDYDDSGNPISGLSQENGRMLAGMIEQVNQNVQKHFTLQKPIILLIKPHQDYTAKRSYYFSKLNRLQSEFNLKDTDTLGMYHQAWWENFISKQANSMKYPIPNRVLINLVKRWAFFDKSYKISDIKKDIDKEPFLSWVLELDKKDHKDMVKKNMFPFETLVLELGSEILKNTEGFLSANPDKTVQNIRKDLAKAIVQIRNSKDINDIKILKRELEKIKSIGGFDAIVPSEGLLFKFRGKIFKIVGAYSSVNSLLGLLKFK